MGKGQDEGPGALTPAFCLREVSFNSSLSRVMPALVAGIHAKSARGAAWMAGTSPAMTAEGLRPHSRRNATATFAFAWLTSRRVREGRCGGGRVLLLSDRRAKQSQARGV
jgi:hypothetical protein